MRPWYAQKAPQKIGLVRCRLIQTYRLRGHVRGSGTWHGAPNTAPKPKPTPPPAVRGHGNLLALVQPDNRKVRWVSWARAGGAPEAKNQPGHSV